MNQLDNDILISVEGLSKKFCKDLKTSLWYGIKDLFLGVTGNRNNRELRPKEFWALKDINFQLRRGECLGLIGHNGAGKSTLLKILNGLINPDAGKVTIKGRVGALIELGAGFNPILTGRENIYNNGAVLGFTRNEIENKIEEIIDFSEIREFIDMPVQNYSSGMKVRLGFAIAAQMEPDVLIVDEVLAVGDVGFRIKCLNRISELLNKCAVILVSHSMPQIARICTNGILLDKGKTSLLTNDVGLLVEKYYVTFEDNYKSNEINPFGITIKDFNVNGRSIKENATLNLKHGEDIILSFKFVCPSDIENFSVHLPITDDQMIHVALTSSLMNLGLTKNNNQLVSVDCKVPCLFTNGRFYLGLTIIETNINENQYTIGKTLFKKENYIKFFVKESPLTTSVPVLLNSNFVIKK
ncbi:lipopolysaccharide transport system ATP-binding protein [Winogradskyella wandonensis]|uniref:Lipopolysaccharide transport system ATP-binding protein n=1 Tax=Winogradskyella wandonensis TaxID=1442586 RepID=A0A4R1KVR7_9FLAO|nr:ABC transporter ATP-binding protein [Winogradskyella wandonensis]TCK68810.1 lipopolysaccharide transport system ATP-binding protein [Winogradskyella wandonensis]